MQPAHDGSVTLLRPTHSERLVAACLSARGGVLSTVNRAKRVHSYTRASTDDLPPTVLIDTWSNTRKAMLYMEWAVHNLEPLATVLDIGAGDGIAADALPPHVAYSGVDIGADIYTRTDRVTYIEDYRTLRTVIAGHPSADLVTIFDVLEHTADFTTLFRDGISCSQQHVFVSLPNEMNIEARIRFLLGQQTLAHGLDLLHAQPGHKHQWLISFPSARDVLNREAEMMGFAPTHQVFIRNLPRKRWKRWLVRALERPLPVTLKAHGIGFVFHKRSV